MSVSSHSDIRWGLQRALSTHATHLLQERYSREKGLALQKILTQLSLLSPDIRIASPCDLRRLRGVGPAWISIAKAIMKNHASSIDMNRPYGRPFLLAAPAFLVAILQVEQDVSQSLSGNFIVEGNTTLVPVKEIVSRARKLCCEELPYLNHHSDIHNAPVKRTHKKELHEETPRISPQSNLALRRLDHLVTLGFLTRKQRRTYPVYSLTEAGRIGNKILNSDADYVPFMMGARSLQKVANLDTLVTSSAGQATVSSINQHIASENPLVHDSSEKTEQLLLLVDSREGGNSEKLRYGMRDSLLRVGIPFEEKNLAIGDYGWSYRQSDTKEVLIPVLVERKRLDDLSDSINDGRFFSQCTRMMHAQLMFPATELHYIVEGEYAAYRVTTCCNKGCIGRHGQANEEMLEKKLQELIEKGFHLHRTKSFRETVAVLAKLHTSLSERFLPNSKSLQAKGRQQSLPNDQFITSSSYQSKQRQKRKHVGVEIDMPASICVNSTRITPTELDPRTEINTDIRDSFSKRTRFSAESVELCSSTSDTGEIVNLISSDSEDETGECVENNNMHCRDKQVYCAKSNIFIEQELSATTSLSANCTADMMSQTIFANLGSTRLH